MPTCRADDVSLCIFHAVAMLERLSTMCSSFNCILIGHSDDMQHVRAAYLRGKDCLPTHA